MLSGSLGDVSQPALSQSQVYSSCPGLPGVETACYVCMVNHRDQLVIWAAFVVAVPFSEVDVDVGLAFWGHVVPSYSRIGCLQYGGCVFVSKLQLFRQMLQLEVVIRIMIKQDPHTVARNVLIWEYL